MNIKPAPGKVYLKVEKPTAGSLDLSSKPTVVEYGEVIAVGADVGSVNVGDKVFVKGWALDVVTYQKETYYFIDIASGGILAIVTE